MLLKVEIEIIVSQMDLKKICSLRFVHESNISVIVKNHAGLTAPALGDVKEEFPSSWEDIYIIFLHITSKSFYELYPKAVIRLVFQGT